MPSDCRRCKKHLSKLSVTPIIIHTFGRDFWSRQWWRVGYWTPTYSRDWGAGPIQAERGSLTHSHSSEQLQVINKTFFMKTLKNPYMAKIWSELRFLDMVFDNTRFKLPIGYYFLTGFHCPEFGIILWCGTSYLQYTLSLTTAVSGRLMAELVASHL